MGVGIMDGMRELEGNVESGLGCTKCRAMIEEWIFLMGFGEVWQGSRASGDWV
jgi:hypothetical protein